MENILKNSSTPTKLSVKRHLIIWGLITIYLVILDPVSGNLGTQIALTSIIMLTYAIGFYSIGLFLLPKFWNAHFLILAFFAVLSAVIYELIYYVNFRYLFPFFRKDFYSERTALQMILKGLFSFTLSAVPAIAYFFCNLSIENIRTQSEREKSLLIRELNFLKNQFNSHITFNFLNYCYSNIHQTSKKTADAIELFSNMLRYSLEIRPDEKVPIEKEIEYINNFIEMQKLLTAHVSVAFTCQGELQNKIILSRLLITFVENAFKHGQLHATLHPITITLNGYSDIVNLKVSNLKNHKRNLVKNTGVGQDNVTKVLQLYYPGKHELSIEQNHETYQCDLKLNVNSNAN